MVAEGHGDLLIEGNGVSESASAGVGGGGKEGDIGGMGAIDAGVGDATEDVVLLKAGVDRCKSVVVALNTDPDNLYCTISARTMNPTARIVARVEDV